MRYSTFALLILLGEKERGKTFASFPDIEFARAVMTKNDVARLVTEFWIEVCRYLHEIDREICGIFRDSTPACLNWRFCLLGIGSSSSSKHNNKNRDSDEH